MRGVLAQDEAERLVLAYLALRGEAHRRSLDLSESAQTDAALTVHREVVCETWERLFEEPRPAGCRSIFRAVIRQRQDHKPTAGP